MHHNIGRIYSKDNGAQSVAHEMHAIKLEDPKCNAHTVRMTFQHCHGNTYQKD